MNIINDADEKEAGIDERLAGADEESTAEETTGKVKRFLQLHPARQELRTHIWPQKELKKQPKQRNVQSR